LDRSPRCSAHSVPVSDADKTAPSPTDAHSSHNSQVLDLFAQDNRLNLYAGELEVRPPDAPTTDGNGRCPNPPRETSPVK
jgi:hypothetical protein